MVGKLYVQSSHGSVYGKSDSRILYPDISGSEKGTTISPTPDPPRLNAMSLASGVSLVASEGRGALKQGGRGVTGKM